MLDRGKVILLLDLILCGLLGRGDVVTEMVVGEETGLDYRCSFRTLDDVSKSMLLQYSISGVMKRMKSCKRYLIIP